MNDEQFMIDALHEARKSLNSGDWPVGCVIVKNGKVVSKARNKVYSSNDKVAHAELIAIQSISEELALGGEQFTLYSTYEPCPMCIGAILLTHIGRVVCGPDLDASGGLSLCDHLSGKFSQKRYSFELKKGVLLEQCASVFLSGEPLKDKNHRKTLTVSSNMYNI